MNKQKVSSFKNPMAKSERVIGWIYTPIHIFLLPILIGMFGSTILTKFGIPANSVYLDAMYYLFSFAVIIIFMFRFLKKSFSDIFDNLRGCLFSIVIGYIINIALGILISVIVVHITGDAQNPNSSNLDDAISTNFKGMIGVIILLGPIVEETLFRGVLFGSLRKKSRFAAYAVSMLVFAFYHLWQSLFVGFDWTVLIYMLQYLPGGFVLAWCYEKSGTIWAPIVLHAIINAVALAVNISV